MKKLIKKAYAKVNLALDVLRRREDGYHDVSMIMQNISLYDVLTFEADYADKTEIILTGNNPKMPLDGSNLVYKAVALMLDVYGIKARVHVDIDKHIPVEAGMAGGSTDCAAAFHAVNELFDIGEDLDRLMRLGVTLGADVPYCLMGRTALAEGIGDILTPITPLTGCYLLVAKPSVSVSTGMVYGRLSLDGVDLRPDIPKMKEALAAGDIDGVAAHMGNVLESVTADMYPEINRIKHLMNEAGALNAIMSGSGPTVFGIFKDREAAGEAAVNIRACEKVDGVYITEPISGGV